MLEGWEGEAEVFVDRLFLLQSFRMIVESIHPSSVIFIRNTQHNKKSRTRWFRLHVLKDEKVYVSPCLMGWRTVSDVWAVRLEVSTSLCRDVLLVFYIYLFSAHVCTCACVCRSENNVREVFPFHHVEHKDHTQIVRLQALFFLKKITL